MHVREQVVHDYFTAALVSLSFRSHRIPGQGERRKHAGTGIGYEYPLTESAYRCRIGRLILHDVPAAIAFAATAIG
jgi:hypothetical protein